MKYLRNIFFTVTINTEKEFANTSVDELENANLEDLHLINIKTDCLDLKDYTSSISNAEQYEKEYFENGPYVKVSLQSGHTLIVKKSSLCWLLDNKQPKLSSDRMYRVMHKQLAQVNENKSFNKNDNLLHPTTRRQIYIGEWVVFYERSAEGSNSKYLKHMLVGRILSFCYLTGTTRQKQYSLETAPTSTKVGQPKKGIGCLCSWYNIGFDGILIMADFSNHGFKNITGYRYSIPSPNMVNNQNGSLNISLNPNIVEQLIKLNIIRKRVDTSTNSESSIDDEESFYVETSDSSVVNLSDISDSSDKVNHQKVLIEEEKYYSVFYDGNWNIGSILKKNDEKSQAKMKFLKSELNLFIWPKVADIQTVNYEYIFYGPIYLNGLAPFTLKRHDKIKIIKNFEELKRKY